MRARRSLSPAQLRFFKVSPSNLRLSSNPIALQLLQESLIETSPDLSVQTIQNCNLDLTKISKSSYGNFQTTVRNFGVLINKNFGNQSEQHQLQKFGGRSKQINQIMMEKGKDKINNQNYLDARIRELSDIRVSIQGECKYNQFPIKLTLHSFQIDSLQSERKNQLPLQYLKLLTIHVCSSDLIYYISSSLKSQGNQLIVDYDTIYTRVRNLKNTDLKYQRQEFAFEKYSYQLILKAPILDIECDSLKYKQKTIIDNHDMIRILQSNFSNVDHIMGKYINKNQIDILVQSSKKETNQNQPQT